jgi:hypothetical protein
MSSATGRAWSSLGKKEVNDVDREGTAALTGELGAVHYLSGEPYQITATLGLRREIAPCLEVSIVALAGQIDASLHFGLLVGLTPKVRLWRTPRR